LREAFVTDLFAEILGPRGGIRETLSDSPLDEYITGVLAPLSQVPPAPDIDDTAELPTAEGSRSDEDDAPEPDVTAPPIFSPVLNPQNRPHSLGLSFIVDAENGQPLFDVCLTWSRYEQEGNDWCRQPRSAILNRASASQSTYWLDSNGSETQVTASAEISFQLLIRPRGNRTFLVSVYLVNRVSPPSDGSYPGPAHHIFQPQIRVNCTSGTRIVPGVDGDPQDEEERGLQFLYRERPVLARGHLCSAVWKDIDPEVQTDAPAHLDHPEAAQLPPFVWGDGELLANELRRTFSPPAVRTEFVPIYRVEAPRFEWREEHGVGPELSASQLAELWDPNSLQAALRPLAESYRRWVDSFNPLRTTLSADQGAIADRLLQTCQRAAHRIERGIEILVRDEAVRLAFCFSMKAIAVQSSWPPQSRRSELIWRSFQLAFILMTLESIVNPRSEDRDVCDLLWVPTGGGKTEAYLALAAFTIAFRRRRALARPSGDRTGAGVSVISRYTLRLLTIQQFRRAVKMMTACEYLRVDGLDAHSRVGWRPANCTKRDNFLWGSSRFSVGLWVGGSVTPNRLLDTWGGNQTIYGALSVLRGQAGEGEPAQILKCPACEATLAIPSRQDGGLPAGTYLIHLIVRGNANGPIQPQDVTFQSIQPTEITFNPIGRNSFSTLSIRLVTARPVFAEEFDGWWTLLKRRHPNLDLTCARASRPGYFVRQYVQQGNSLKDYDFEIFCPSPECPLHRAWCEGAPIGWVSGSAPHPNSPTAVPNVPAFPDGNRFTHVEEPFRRGSNFCSTRVPIPAWTVDDQIYHRCPSMVIATVDKFARPAFEPRAAGIFGNVDFHHCLFGFYRLGQHPSTSDVGGHPGPAGRGQAFNYNQVNPLDAPDLLLQDELHLIEGPLGSLVGLYETAVDFLCQETTRRPVKYIASTATVRQAEEQVQSVFCRRLLSFPPPGLSVEDRFFFRFIKQHPLEDTGPGQLYLGVCAPGRGPLTPAIRLWARLLNTCWQHRANPRSDPFWTLVGYFNAIRELAGARALYRQDIPERLRRISMGNLRPLPDEACQELSGRTASTELPVILDLLNEDHGQDALFTTSMFGTGVDIPRLGLMLVHGQPKSTSSYIQATGRVGRTQGALVVVFLRAARPRDLNHYEFFCGYHQQLHRFVEPITVMPFSPGALDRACGPVGVFMLRNRRAGAIPWYDDLTAAAMANARSRNPEVTSLPNEIESRAQHQPISRRPPANSAGQTCNAELDQWQQVASRNSATIRYVEYAIVDPPTRPVVLGDPTHQYAGFEIVYENAPQSLREIEESCGFET